MSLLRVGDKAPHLPKRRRPSGREKKPKFTVADVDEYNQRQLMRCVETRQRWSDKDKNIIGPPGMRHATTVQRVEVAHRVLPAIELAAYMAKDHGTQEHQNRLVDEVEQAILKQSKKEHWRYHKKVDQEDPIRLLASIVVEEWLSPVKYWRLRKDENDEDIVRPIISSFARSMKCKRETWRVRWHDRFLAFQGYPTDWYDIGKARVNGGK